MTRFERTKSPVARSKPPVPVWHLTSGVLVGALPDTDDDFECDVSAKDRWRPELDVELEASLMDSGDDIEDGNERVGDWLEAESDSSPVQTGYSTPTSVPSDISFNHNDYSRPFQTLDFEQ